MDGGDLVGVGGSCRVRGRVRVGVGLGLTLTWPKTYGSLMKDRKKSTVCTEARRVGASTWLGSVLGSGLGTRPNPKPNQGRGWVGDPDLTLTLTSAPRSRRGRRGRAARRPPPAVHVYTLNWG